MYYWRVTAYDAIGNSATSSTFSFVNGPSASPSIPTPLTPANDAFVPGNTTRLTWAPGDRAYSLDYYASLDPNFSSSSIITGYIGWLEDRYSGTVFNLPNDGRTVYWKVRSSNSLGKSEYSPVMHFISDCEPAFGYGRGQFTDYADVDSCKNSDTDYLLKDISRRGNIPSSYHAHGGHMTETAAIITQNAIGTVHNSSTDWLNDRAAVDAHVNAGRVYDFFLANFRREQDSTGLNSYDGKGSSMKSIDGYTTGSCAGWPYSPGFSDGDAPFVFYCSGTDESGLLDVATHEWTHGVTANASGRISTYDQRYNVSTKGLLSYGEPGALREAFSDWVGIATNRYYKPSIYDSMKWKFGGANFIRDLENPMNEVLATRVLYGVQSDFRTADTYNGDLYYPTQNCIATAANNCGVYRNVGVPNKMFYLLSEPGQHEHPVTHVQVNGIGIDAALRIAFQANMEYWKGDATFLKAREGMVAASQDLYPANSSYVFQINNAWAAVGVGTVPAISLSSSNTAWGTVAMTGSSSWGATATAVATPSPGYAFESWEESGVAVSSSPRYSFTVTGDKTLVAKFAATPPVLSVTPSSGYLGMATIGTTSPVHTFTATNTGTQPLTNASIYLSGANAAEFSVTSDGCSGQTLSPSASCIIQVSFVPAAAGTRIASLTIPSTNPAIPSYVMALSGFGGFQPIMVGSSSYYSSVQTAYNSTGDGGEIRLWTADFDESLTCNRSVNVTIRGGYDGSFVERIGKTVLKGTLTITNGTLIVYGVYLGGSSNQSTISVVPSGPGTGLVTSAAGEIYCGSTCSAVTLNSASVTLSAAPDTCSTFTGWSGSNCGGTGSCTVDMGMDASVTASFGKVPPTVSFTSKPTPQVAPNTVQFTSTSQCADSWVWDFGDGTTSTEENPSHTYDRPGNYTVALSVGNAGGSSAATSKKVLSYFDITPILMMLLGD